MDSTGKRIRGRDFAIPVRPIDESMHYFLVVHEKADGRLSAFIRNPESKRGTSSAIAPARRGCELRLRAPDKGDVTGSVASDTLTIDDLPAGPKGLRYFHRATPQELRWYYPRPRRTWSYRVPTQGADGWPSAYAGGGRNAPSANCEADAAPSYRNARRTALAVHPKRRNRPPPPIGARRVFLRLHAASAARRAIGRKERHDAHGWPRDRRYQRVYADNAGTSFLSQYSGRSERRSAKTAHDRGGSADDVLGSRLRR